mgnify:CR=1 FL=1
MKHDLPPRRGPHPQTTDCAPHSQVDQLVPEAERRRLGLLLAGKVKGLGDISDGPSRRAPPGTIGLYLAPDCCCGDAEAFLLANEIAHVHIEDDGALHAVLPDGIREQAIEAGWAEYHPLAGQPTVSPRTVMIYAPRDENEVDTVMLLLQETYGAARARTSADG